jgi:peptide chain release factor 1
MLDKLEAIKARFDTIGVALTNPEIIGDNKKFGQFSKEYRSLEKIVRAYGEYKKLLDDVDFYKEALNGDDEELRELAKEELPQLEEKQERMDTRRHRRRRSFAVCRRPGAHVPALLRGPWLENGFAERE